MSRRFFRRLFDPREHVRMVRQKVTSPIGRALGLSKRNQQAEEDTQAIEEAAKQEQDAARQARDQAANLSAQQSVLLANQQAEDAIAKAQRDAPIDRLDVVIGDDGNGTGFNFRKMAAGIAGDTVTAARKARAFFRR